MRVVFICASSPIAEFMAWLAEATPEAEAVFIATHPGTAFYLWARGKRVSWIRPTKSAKRIDAPEEFLQQHAPFERAFHRNRGYTLQQLREIAPWVSRFRRAIMQTLSELQPELVVIWNGEGLQGRAAADCARTHGIHLVYCEQGFLRGTVAVDTEGANRRSTPSRLSFDEMRQRTDSRRAFTPWDWREGRSSAGRRKRIGARTILLFCERVVNRAYYGALAVAGRRQFDPLGRPAWRHLTDPLRSVGRSLALLARPEPALPARYVLIPLQVSTDTQVLVNSPDFPTLESFVEFCLRWIPPEMPVLVSVHPAEPVAECHGRIRAAIRRRPGARWVDRMSTRSLLRDCLALVTLNSTIGLEAIAGGIPTFALGDALYRRPGLATAIGADDGAGLREGLRHPERHRPDPELVSTLLHYLSTNHLLEANLHDLSAEQARRFASRLQDFLDAKPQPATRTSAEG